MVTRPDDEALVAALSDVARELAAGETTHEPVPGAWQRLQERRARAPRATLRRWMLGLGTAVVMAAAAALVLAPRWGRALTYEVGAGAIEEGGYIRGAGDAEAAVRFSDGTRIDLQPGARLSVASPNAHGARLRVDEGEARFSVKHLPKAAWTVEAGPYVVEVTGTMFDVRWSSTEEVAEVRLRAGSVRVTGPLLTEHVTLRPGQHLTARLTVRELRIDENGAGTPVAPHEPAHAGPAAGAPAAALPPTPEDQPRAEAPPPAVPARAHAARPHARAVALAGPTAPAWNPAGWSARVSSGDARGVIAEATDRGIDRVLAETDGPALVALADAARYTRRADLAVRVLRAQRERFAGTPAAGAAAFFLGRLTDDRGATAEGLAWYQRYLSEAPDGAYAAEALGRAMLAVAKLSGRPAARVLARQYLARFPDGTYLLNAQAILEGP